MEKLNRKKPYKIIGRFRNHSKEIGIWNTYTINHEEAIKLIRESYTEKELNPVLVLAIDNIEENVDEKDIH